MQGNKFVFDTWLQLKSVWEHFSGVASVISSTGFIGYFIKELVKKYQKPELTCAIMINSSQIYKLGRNHQDEYGSLALTPNGTSELEQECTFTISNVSDYTAIKFRIVNREHIDWEFPLESTSILKGYEKESLKFSLKCIAKDEVINNIKIIPIKQILIEYRNTKGKKYILTFSPTEPDLDKRNICRAA